MSDARLARQAQTQSLLEKSQIRFKVCDQAELVRTGLMTAFLGILTALSDYLRLRSSRVMAAHAGQPRSQDTIRNDSFNC